MKFVDFKKIDPSGRYGSRQQFLLDNLVYYDHWAPGWDYEVSKDSLIQGLKECLTVYAPLKANLYETDLLLGEIAHYLYNLGEEKYYDTAEAWYRKAIALDDSDCRGYWFLAYHYSTSDKIVKGVSWFNKALTRVNSATGKDFWQEYAFGMMLGGLTAHSRYGLDKYLHLGGTSTLSQIMDSTLRAKSIQSDADITYSERTLWWSHTKGDSGLLTSLPLGVRLEVDSSWKLQINGYSNRTSAVVLKPPTAKSSKGVPIGYSIGLVVRVAGEGEQLKDFMASLMKVSGERDVPFPFADRYPSGLSYTVKDKAVYAAGGGAHFHFIGIERAEPSYPGMALEGEGREIDSEPGQVEIHRLSIIHTRFPGRIFYLFILDTCEDIHEESWNTFRGFVKDMRLD